MKKIRIAYHPWEYLLEELRARWRSQSKFADLLGITKAEVNDLIKGRRNITARLAVRIGTAFGTSADIWLKLQNRFDIFLVEKNRKEEKQIEMIRTRKNELAYA